MIFTASLYLTNTGNSFNLRCCVLIIPLLAFAAMLSVNLGIVNLLPIPALDGGKILFVIIEAITKKRVPKKVEAIINGIFMILLLGLMIFVTVNDIMRI